MKANELIELCESLNEDKAQKLLDWIKKQVNIDLTDRVSSMQRKPTKYVNIEIKYDQISPEDDMQSLLNLQKQYPEVFSMQQNGANMTAFFFGKGLK